MADIIGSSTTFKVGVPAFADPADIQTAFKLYHYGSASVPASYAAIVTDTAGAIGVAGHLKNLNDLKAPLANPTFTGTVNLSGATVSYPTGSVTSSAIADGTIVNADISASAAIAVSKLAASAVTIGSTSITLGNTAATIAGLTLTLPTFGSGGTLFSGSTSGSTTVKASAVAGGTVTIPAVTGTLITTGDSKTITNSMIADGTVENAKLANKSITINNQSVDLGGSVTITSIGSASDIGFDSQGFSNYSLLYNSNSTTTEALAPGTSGHILFSNGTTGAPSWGALQISNSNVASNAAIEYSKLSLGTSIKNSDIASDAAIVDTKLATISTAGKVSNSATTATSSGTSANTIVMRGTSGDFTAGTITATLNGNVKGNVTADATGNGKVTFSNTSGTTYSPVGKIFVQSTEPASPVTGDIWMW